MTDAELDARLAELLRDERSAPPDKGFADRVIALAAYDLARRHWRHRTTIRIAREAVAFAAILAAFIFLARIGPQSAGPGDIIPLASPAMAGLVMLLLWGMTTLSPARR